jgi:hypothetical protein
MPEHSLRLARGSDEPAEVEAHNFEALRAAAPVEQAG